ncbi:tRNA (guanosine(37)-N1)-methyltransferase TrmD [Candidatus Woesebacteria bacterium]|jgi:tRNA (guanine37-N1)-methyltransferase|nr:tRNA (guanosine(37)-N1)-methyltransferase TrmD [Candidatus Woesebacteria bacterium]HNV45355.1 tRNA (guanosine(37)-N1)-methyltransferase TrmD [Candidatus Woesebacteria bacterium]HOA11984.1 tRNA (guanosine(37)-N1)-methyltransferase TrmD [Candidatus Woesebacteria bacterium]HOC07335.1 tRNA (guanosine(37)-N1)-methyltransferase TrmD [Candidatus Woesebacteria bacterium]HOI05254.1 tRNA (guanosine(37)-N1)-methyltransferase TrmD [Candidatus Woesebacteria bacterium]
MQINFLTIFPEYFSNILDSSILKRAQQKQLVKYQVINLRDFAQDKHHTTDDRPFGGGPGMVMMIEPIDLALHSLNQKKGTKNKKIILTSAKGRLFTQASARQWSKLAELTIICGHYEGVDERVAKYLVDAEVRIGDYVLTGGEPAAAVMTDAVVRLLPGVLGNDESGQDESHRTKGLAGPEQYTRPANYRGWSVPEVLLSGDPKKISAYKNQSRNLS